MKMVSPRLTIAEKFTLQYLLQKLENFHLEHYEKKTIIIKQHGGTMRLESEEGKGSTFWFKLPIANGSYSGA
jgi:light-regulated signal transduction histidine kinase (bacteriophytochrome)